MASILAHDTMLGGWPGSWLVVSLGGVSTRVLVGYVDHNAGLMLMVRVALQSPQIHCMLDVIIMALIASVIACLLLSAIAMIMTEGVPVKLSPISHLVSVRGQVVHDSLARSRRLLEYFLKDLFGLLAIILGLDRHILHWMNAVPVRHSDVVVEEDDSI